MTQHMLDRRDVLPVLFPEPEKLLFISGLAGSSKDAAGLTNDGDNLFTMAGTMGAATTTGLGVALSAPEREVVVVTGDGELLMNIGSLVTVATMAPNNLSLVCLDNGCHGETGGQSGHTSNKTDLEIMAQGAGILSTLTVSATEELAEARRFLSEAAGPRFLRVKVAEGPPTAYRRNLDPAECRLRFRNAYLNA